MSSPTETGRRFGRNRDQGTPDAPPAPPASTPPAPSADAPPSEAEVKAEKERKAAERKAAKEAAAKAEAAEIEAIKATATADVPAEIATATTPTRNRKPPQLAMDEIVQQNYTAWVKAGKPTLWQKMPVVHYYLSPDAVAKRRSLVRKGADVATATEDAPGVRIRFGTPVPLTPEMAQRIGKPEHAGKTLLSWCAVDKRKVAPRKPATAGSK